jgi:hypothetical protein
LHTPHTIGANSVRKAEAQANSKSRRASEYIKYKNVNLPVGLDLPPELQMFSSLRGKNTNGLSLKLCQQTQSSTPNQLSVWLEQLASRSLDRRPIRGPFEIPHVLHPRIPIADGSSQKEAGGETWSTIWSPAA